MKTNLTFEELPTAIGNILLEIKALRSDLVATDRACTPTPASKPEPEPIGVDRACKLLLRAPSTVYHLCRTGILPCYKRGKKLYFFEKELMAYIAEGRRSTIAEIQSEIGDGK